MCKVTSVHSTNIILSKEKTSSLAQIQIKPRTKTRTQKTELETDD
jgi:hypothetical protein